MPVQMDRKEWAHDYPKCAYNCTAMKTENKNIDLQSLGDFTIKYRGPTCFVENNLNITEHILKYSILKRHFFANKVCMGNSVSPSSLVDEGILPSQQIWYRIITNLYVISEGRFSTHQCKTALNLLVLDYSAIQLISVLRGFYSTVMLPMF